MKSKNMTNLPGISESNLEELGAMEKMYVISCVSVLGHDAWVTDVRAGEGLGEEAGPVISLTNRAEKARIYRGKEAAAVLPAVHTCYPEGVIVEVGKELSALLGLVRTWLNRAERYRERAEKYQDAGEEKAAFRALATASSILTLIENLLARDNKGNEQPNPTDPNFTEQDAGSGLSGPGTPETGGL